MINEIEKILVKSKSIALENPKESYSLAVKAFEIAESNNWEIKKAHAYYNMAYACRVMSDYSNGLDYAFKALDIFISKNDTLGMLKVRNIIGIIYYYYGDYTSSLEYYITALDILKSEKNPKLESSILNNIGEIYREAAQVDKALEYYNKALEISLTNNFELNASVIYLNIGEVYNMQKKDEESLAHFRKSYELLKNNKNPLIQGEVETKLGRAMFMQKEYILAKNYYISALQKFNKVNNKFYLIELLINLSVLHEVMGVSSNKHLIEALNNAIETGLESKVSLIYKLLADYHEKRNEYEESLNYYKLYHLKEKEVEASNLSKKLEILSIEFNYQKEKNENQRINSISEKIKRETIYYKNELNKIKKQNAKLMKVSTIDELTQIYNRRGIYEMASKYLGKSEDLLDVIFIIDIDYFKKYNDEWGHIKGDDCLKLISYHLKELPHEDYFIGRFGGEEFLCCMKVNNIKKAIEIADDIRKKVENLQLSYSQKKNSNTVTVSLGGIVGSMKSDNLNELIDKADKNLYYAKQNGRNMVCISEIE